MIRNISRARGRASQCMNKQTLAGVLSPVTSSFVEAAAAPMHRSFSAWSPAMMTADMTQAGRLTDGACVCFSGWERRSASASASAAHADAILCLKLRRAGRPVCGETGPAPAASSSMLATPAARRLLQIRHTSATERRNKGCQMNF